ncbi:ABC transporter ATP-binding protein [Dehalococcoides mccartyi]|uniref:FeS assembly ATPase SufC, putative n=1 Tax=Dehalococcoides mccartyi (strain ATCC BAA-2266 / KCTC 15142 / 195) TaxID=243164 RepID=Q3Z8A6_DEHM1|nr:ABC transporter ATP-binding protein [Dehalococcoides mccartyi]AAW39957.1 FeS assembly ATPase SufC, putative [Dehalococcoides mccartyi 195]
MDLEILLEVKDLHVEVDGREILHGVDLVLPAGETHVIFGPNGSGKTTLLMTLMGFPRYKITQGQLIFNGKDITHVPIDERARLGIGISFQRPPVVRGVKLREMVRSSLRTKEDSGLIDELAKKAHMTDFLERDVNHGFSGGEIKRSELLQLLAQGPDMVLLDEPESGVDLENIALIGSLINDLLEKKHPIRERKRGGLVITHTGHILDYVNARTGYVLCHGRINCTGDPRDMLETIKQNGYQECVECPRKI